MIFEKIWQILYTIINRINDKSTIADNFIIEILLLITHTYKLQMDSVHNLQTSGHESLAIFHTWEYTEIHIISTKINT